MTWRCYTFTLGGWREWGVDYPSLATARSAVAAYQKRWPKSRFTIRRAGR